MAQIICPQLKKTFSLNPLLSLMGNLLQNGVPVASSCKGDGICGKCHMTVFSDKQISPPLELEKKTMERNQVPVGQRLSCQLYLNQDVVVQTTYW